MKRLTRSDTAAKEQMSSMSLFKMSKHGCANLPGLPTEVTHIMPGQFVDEYTIMCMDIFAMSGHGIAASEDSTNIVFQTNMLGKRC